MQVFVQKATEHLDNPSKDDNDVFNVVIPRGQKIRRSLQLSQKYVRRICKKLQKFSFRYNFAVLYTSLIERELAYLVTIPSTCRGQLINVLASLDSLFGNAPAFEQVVDGTCNRFELLVEECFERLHKNYQISTRERVA